MIKMQVARDFVSVVIVSERNALNFNELQRNALLIVKKRTTERYFKCFNFTVFCRTGHRPLTHMKKC